MTRQRLNQIANVAKGKCSYCDNPLHPDSKSRCYTHLMKARVAARKRTGCSPGYKTGMGRMAFPRVKQERCPLCLGPHHEYDCPRDCSEVVIRKQVAK